jgi:anti-anti-sigma factor
VVDGTDVHVTLTGALDLPVAPALSRGLLEVIDTTTGAVVVNMAGATFLDSTGIRGLLAARQQLSVHHRSMVLRDVSASTRRVLDLAGIGAMLGDEGPDAASG